MSKLYQPLFSNKPEPGHNISDVLTMEQMIDLLKEEEDYWEGEQHNTKLMITRLRKIFYDQWGWNSELIRGAADIETRYEVKILDDASEHSRPLRRYKQNEYQPKHREVVYTDHDRVYGNTRAGQVPFIYKADHQEVVLPDGTYCDSAHILAGLDAWNYLAPVSPLPKFLMFLKNLFPHVDSNVDIVTWLGDIASSSGDFLFEYLRNGKKPLDTPTMQKYIDTDAPGSDMLGDIDPYVISRHYDVGSTNGKRYTEILTEYYYGVDGQIPLHKKRVSEFCSVIGLEGWNGEKFKNEDKWLTYYHQQLRDNTSFQVFSLTDEKLHSVILPLKIWIGCYKSVLKFDELLSIWLLALKNGMKSETL